MWPAAGAARPGGVAWIRAVSALLLLCTRAAARPAGIVLLLARERESGRPPRVNAARPANSLGSAYAGRQMRTARRPPAGRPRQQSPRRARGRSLAYGVNPMLDLTDAGTPLTVR